MIIAGPASRGTVALGLMQSIVDETEERLRKEQQSATGQSLDPMVEARVSASSTNRRAQEKIGYALFSAAKVDLNELKAQLYQHLGEALGVERHEETSSYAFGRALEDAVTGLSSESNAELSKKLGLDELGLSITDVIEAIKNPSSDAAVALEKALEEKHGGGKDTVKALQRMEDIADPKTLAELKLDEHSHDPTRVVDEETEAERRKDIAAREVAAKLEHVNDMGKALAERAKALDAETSGPTSNEAGELLTALAAVLETANNATAGSDVKAQDNRGSPEDLKTADGNEPQPEAPESEAIAQHEGKADDLRQKNQDIFPLDLDDNGLYLIAKPGTKPASGSAPSH